MTSEAEPEPIAVQREKGNRRFSDWLAGPNLHHLLDERDSRAEPLVQLAGARTSLRCKAVTITFYRQQLLLYMLSKLKAGHSKTDGGDSQNWTYAQRIHGQVS